MPDLDKLSSGSVHLDVPESPVDAGTEFRTRANTHLQTFNAPSQPEKCVRTPVPDCYPSYAQACQDYQDTGRQRVRYTRISRGGTAAAGVSMVLWLLSMAADPQAWTVPVLFLVVMVMAVATAATANDWLNANGTIGRAPSRPTVSVPAHAALAYRTAQTAPQRLRAVDAPAEVVARAQEAVTEIDHLLCLQAEPEMSRWFPRLPVGAQAAEQLLTRAAETEALVDLARTHHDTFAVSVPEPVEAVAQRLTEQIASAREVVSNTTSTSLPGLP